MLGSSLVVLFKVSTAPNDATAAPKLPKAKSQQPKAGKVTPAAATEKKKAGDAKKKQGGEHVEVKVAQEGGEDAEKKKHMQAEMDEALDEDEAGGKSRRVVKTSERRRVTLESMADSWSSFSVPESQHSSSSEDDDGYADLAVVEDRYSKKKKKRRQSNPHELQLRPGGAAEMKYKIHSSARVSAIG